RLERIVFGGRDLLQRRRVHDYVDTVERAVQPFTVADVTDEIPQHGRVEALLHLVLLQLVPTVDDEAPQVESLARGLHGHLADRPGTTGDQQRLAFEGKHRAPGFYRRWTVPGRLSSVKAKTAMLQSRT